MRLIKIGIGNTDPTVGAFTSNTDQLIALALEMMESRTTLGVFGEMAISGYPPEDLLNWRPFVTDQLSQLRRFASRTERVFPTVFKVGLAVLFDQQVYNCVATVCNGVIYGLVPKEDNPTYNVFYELRKMARGYMGLSGDVEGIPFGDLMYEAPFGRFSSGVCESVWQADGPMVRHAYHGSLLDAYVNASPWRVGVRETRREMLATRSSDNLIIVPYANLVGAQDSLIFDGGGHIFSMGRSLLEIPRENLWKVHTHYGIADLDEVAAGRVNNTTWRLRAEEFRRSNPGQYTLIPVPSADDSNEYVSQMSFPRSFFVPEKVTTNPVEDLLEDLESAIVLGLAGYMEKTRLPNGENVFERIGIANSGGRDSILVLCLAYLYAKQRGADIADFIHCFSFPTKFNTATTRNLSRVSSETLGATFHEIPIEDMVAVAHQLIVAMHGGDESAITRIAKQNLQSRVRALLPLTWGNSSKALILQTGVMSEEAVGYSTMLGDHNAGFIGPLKNLVKTLGNELLAYFQVKYGWDFIGELLATTASAELEDDQSDERDLMPFAILDDCIHLFAGRWLMPDEIYQVLRMKWSDDELRALDPQYQPGKLKMWVRNFVGRFFGQVFKWVQSPLGFHFGNLDLDRERALQLPVVQSLEWLTDSFRRLDEAE